ncbi:pectinesterase family protein [Hymenobacter properus]|uniref:Pectinesterase n=1 Tax=Hymenobacter properus TaxID=2791026 RepID=A0A931BPS4_9BACT|nr:pectinesterase family protein [Hymenobacter properus]MBF9143380.1 pectin esterase [Hymenobacter properus]MBR7722191.1 pectin esterase [Microvirga sp. SRT04]
MKILFTAIALATCAAHAQTPAKTGPITVAQDGTGTYRTVQEAVDAVPNQSQKLVTIRIKKGTYREKLVVPTLKTHIRLVGESKDNTILTFDDHTGDAGGHNTYTSHSVLVQGNDFAAENLTFENTAGYTAGQAVALHVEADRATFTNCRMVGNQDVLFLATDHTRQYFKNCYIEGTTDFIFGASTAVFDHCTILSKKNSFITAASTPPQQTFGFVFLNCKLLADTARAKKVYLGRPWRPNARVVYINTEMGGHIAAPGWDNWKNPENEKTAYFAEYHSTGPGANPQGRVKWSYQMTAAEAKSYTLKAIFAAKEPWMPK